MSRVRRGPHPRNEKPPVRVAPPPTAAAKDRPVVSPAQCRAARAVLGWTQAALAEQAGLARKTIADFEMSLRNLQYRTLRDITLAFEGAGMQFIWPANGAKADGAGPAEGLRYPASLGWTSG